MPLRCANRGAQVAVATDQDYGIALAQQGHLQESDPDCHVRLLFLVPDDRTVAVEAGESCDAWPRKRGRARKENPPGRNPEVPASPEAQPALTSEN